MKTTRELEQDLKSCLKIIAMYEDTLKRIARNAKNYKSRDQARTAHLGLSWQSKRIEEDM